MGIRERRDRERQLLRQRILDAARELFATRGYEAVTMREIARRIEYSATALYSHFIDKETLVRELCKEDFAAFARAFLDQVAAGGDALERLVRAGFVYLGFAEEFPHHYRLMFMTPHPPVNSTDVDLEKGNPEEDGYAFLKKIISEGVAAGRFKYTDVELISQTMWAGVHGVTSLQIAKCNDDWVEWRDVSERAHLMVETLIDGLVSRG